MKWIFHVFCTSRGRLPNSPANPLPTAFFGSKTARKSAAGRVGRIVYKLLIYNLYLTLRGRCYEAKRCFFAADRGMRRGQPWPSGQRRDTAGAASAVRGSDGADSALRHRPGRARLRIGTPTGAGHPSDQLHRVRGQRAESDPVPGSAARAKRISAESECEPVFFMTAARWFSTVRWLMPRSAAMFLLG
jgi:hypothetical protein